MEAETEANLKWLISKIQQFAMEVKEIADAQNGKLVNLDNRLRMLEKHVSTEPSFDKTELMELRARLTNQKERTDRELGTMMEILQKMRESQIGLAGRVDLIEKEGKSEEELPEIKKGLQGDKENLDEMLNDLSNMGKEKPVELPEPPKELKEIEKVV